MQKSSSSVQKLPGFIISFLFFGDLENAACSQQQPQSPDMVCAYLLSLFSTHKLGSVLFSRCFISARNSPLQLVVIGHYIFLIGSQNSFAQLVSIRHYKSLHHFFSHQLQGIRFEPQTSLVYQLPLKGGHKMIISSYLILNFGYLQISSAHIILCNYFMIQERSFLEAQCQNI